MICVPFCSVKLDTATNEVILENSTVKMVSAKDLPFMKSNPKFIFFTDFDGTITLRDSK